MEEEMTPDKVLKFLGGYFDEGGIDALREAFETTPRAERTVTKGDYHTMVQGGDGSSSVVMRTMYTTLGFLFTEGALIALSVSNSPSEQIMRALAKQASVALIIVDNDAEDDTVFASLRGV